MALHIARFRVEVEAERGLNPGMDIWEDFPSAALVASVDGRVMFWSQAWTAEANLGMDHPTDSPRNPSFIDAPVSVHPLGPQGLPRSAQQVKVVWGGGRTAVLESCVLPLTDAGQKAFAYLYVLPPTESKKVAGAVPGDVSPRRPGPIERRILHKLNNVFAKIHSSLDLALDKPQLASGLSWVQQAWESAREGAAIINELQLRESEAAAARVARPGAATPRPTPTTESSAEQFTAKLDGCERLLVAEDDKNMRTLIRAVLAYRGYTVIEAADGEDAVQKYFDNRPIDLVIIDLEMPKLDGRSVLREIRAKEPAVRSVALSGDIFDARGGRLDCNQEFDVFLSKPFRNLDLVRSVRQVLDRPASGNHLPAKSHPPQE
jgi:CheY-like chemotaxis protein